MVSPLPGGRETFLSTEKGNLEKVCFFGGYSDAQRKQIFLLPQYIVDSAEDEESLLALIEGDVEESICALKIKGSGFRNLSHRDYLGSILALGIEREKLGDICIVDDHSAIAFCCSEIANYLIFELESIGSDKVKVEKIAVDKNMESTQKFQSFTDTVASERLDCVVAAIFNLSREKAQNLIKGGFVDYNYEQAQKIDVKCDAGDIISARGYGRFVYRGYDGLSRKGKLNVIVDVYV